MAATSLLIAVAVLCQTPTSKEPAKTSPIVKPSVKSSAVSPQRQAELKAVAEKRKARSQKKAMQRQARANLARQAANAAAAQGTRSAFEQSRLESDLLDRQRKALELQVAREQLNTMANVNRSLRRNELFQQELLYGPASQTANGPLIYQRGPLGSYSTAIPMLTNPSPSPLASPVP